MNLTLNETLHQALPQTLPDNLNDTLNAVLTALSNVLQGGSIAANWPVLIGTGIFGLMIGSFLNVVIHRLPLMMQRQADNYLAQATGKRLPYPDRYNLWLPRSHCPHCFHQIRAGENIPLLSYLVLRGRCRHCTYPISPRYPLVELLTGALSLLMIHHFDLSLTGVAALIFMYLLIALAFIDAATQLLPDELTFCLLWGGLLINVQALFVPLTEAVAGAAIAYLALWSVYWLFKLITGKEGIGYGDFKLFAAIGAWLGYSRLPLILFLASFTGAVIGIITMTVKKQARGTPLPFGPYLALAAMIILLWGNTITSFLPFPFG